MKHPYIIGGAAVVVVGLVIWYYRSQAQAAAAAASNEAQTNTALQDYLQASGLYGGSGGYAQAGFQALNPADLTAQQEAQNTQNAIASTVPATTPSNLGGSGTIIPFTACDCAIGYINATQGGCNCVPDPNSPLNVPLNQPALVPQQVVNVAANANYPAGTSPTNIPQGGPVSTGVAA